MMGMPVPDVSDRLAHTLVLHIFRMMIVIFHLLNHTTIINPMSKSIHTLGVIYPVFHRGHHTHYSDKSNAS